MCRNAFGITGKEVDKIAVKNADKTHDIRVRCAYEEICYIAKDKVTKNIKLMNNWKIFTSKGNGGAGTLQDEKAVAILGKAYIGSPCEICTDSLIPIGNFKTTEEAMNLQKYMKTKFLRFMVGILKVSQNVSQMYINLFHYKILRLILILIGIHQ